GDRRDRVVGRAGGGTRVDVVGDGDRLRGVGPGERDREGEGRGGGYRRTLQLGHVADAERRTGVVVGDRAGPDRPGQGGVGRVRQREREVLVGLVDTVVDDRDVDRDRGDAGGERQVPGGGLVEVRTRGGARRRPGAGGDVNLDRPSGGGRQRDGEVGRGLLVRGDGVVHREARKGVVVDDRAGASGGAGGQRGGGGVGECQREGLVVLAE